MGRHTRQLLVSTTTRPQTEQQQPQVIPTNGQTLVSAVAPFKARWLLVFHSETVEATSAMEQKQLSSSKIIILMLWLPWTLWPHWAIVTLLMSTIPLSTWHFSDIQALAPLDLSTWAHIPHQLISKHSLLLLCKHTKEPPELGAISILGLTWPPTQLVPPPPGQPPPTQRALN